LYYFHKKYKIKIKTKKPKKTFLVGFLDGFFWVGFLLPTLHQGLRLRGVREQEDGAKGVGLLCRA
jgi:hypothetical protein